MTAKKKAAAVAGAVVLSGVVAVGVMMLDSDPMHATPEQRALTQRLEAAKQRCASLQGNDRDACEVTRLGMVRAHYLLGTEGSWSARHCAEVTEKTVGVHPLHRTTCQARQRLSEKHHAAVLSDLESVDGGVPQPKSGGDQ